MLIKYSDTTRPLSLRHDTTSDTTSITQTRHDPRHDLYHCDTKHITLTCINECSLPSYATVIPRSCFLSSLYTKLVLSFAWVQFNSTLKLKQLKTSWIVKIRNKHFSDLHQFLIKWGYYFQNQGLCFLNLSFLYAGHCSNINCRCML